MNQIALDPQPIPEYREISLTKGQFAIVDAADYEWLSKWKWFAHWSKCTQSFYAIRNSTSAKNKQIGVSMAREIMGAPKGILVDHKVRNTLDNRRNNLRLASHTQNKCNQRKPSTNTSGLKGACLKKGKTNRPWFSQIELHGHNKHLGYFDTAEEAHEAYKVAATQLHGEFASFS